MHIAEYENPRVVVFVYVFYLYHFWFLCVNLWKFVWVKFYKIMADGKGFEPSKACTLHAFQACSFNRSDTHL